MMKQFFGYFWGVIAHPGATFDELGRQSSIRPAVMLTVFYLLLGYLNFILSILFSSDWLGTRRELLDPTFVGFYGRFSVGLEKWVPIFFIVLVPILGFLGLVVVPGMAQILSKLWRGQGAFEGSVNTLGFALGVPAIVIHSISELLFTVPANLISGHPYWWAAAMNGEFGPVVASLWNFYTIGIYSIACDLWIIVLGTIAIHRLQKIPRWGAALISLVAYGIWWYGLMPTFVR
jgi:hypothetical protein